MSAKITSSHSLAHFFGLSRGPGRPPASAARQQKPTAKHGRSTAASRVVVTRAPKRSAAIDTGIKRKPGAAKQNRLSARKQPNAAVVDFSHLVAPAANAPATAMEIHRAAAIARGEVELPSRQPEPGSLAAKVLAAGEKRRRL